MEEATGGLAIGRVASATGVAASAIRYYERIGLLKSPRRVGGKRRYDTDAISRLTLIQVAHNAGFTLSEVKTLIDGLGKQREGTAALRRLAKQKLPEVEATLRRAQLLRRLLQAATRCQCPSLEECFRTARKAGLANQCGENV